MGHDDRSVAGLRQVARDCLKEGKHTEAFLHLSHAIKMDQTNCDLLSDRSKCSLENLQYFFALEDAQMMIKLRPESWLGHVRLAEVYQATYNLELAIPSYQNAFQCRDSDKNYCKLLLDKSKRDLVMDTRADM